MEEIQMYKDAAIQRERQCAVVLVKLTGTWSPGEVCF